MLPLVIEALETHYCICNLWKSPWTVQFYLFSPQPTGYYTTWLVLLHYNFFK